MDTPIVDFINEYNEKKPLRFHMPGHKGAGRPGVESRDITEIDGADVLYKDDEEGPPGVIARSEANASKIFGTAKTLYSTEGSSLCIRAMLFLICLLAGSQERSITERRGTDGKSAAKSGIAEGNIPEEPISAESRAKNRSPVTAESRSPVILAGRNAHKTFITAAALLGIDVRWLYGSGERAGSPVSCGIETDELKKRIAEERPDAVYITSPDYLGNISDIECIAEICRAGGVILAVDNAHGAYLKFAGRRRCGPHGEDAAFKSLHPIDLGADICCDSAHKTLPVLTGGAYLHISKSAPGLFIREAERAMSVFASTSPSYLILQSLDSANKLISEGLDERVREASARADELKNRLASCGFTLTGDEPLKICVYARDYGYTGDEISDILKSKNIYCEFHDPDFIVFMLSSETAPEELLTLEEALTNIPRKAGLKEAGFRLRPARRRVSMREALTAESEWVPVDMAAGRVAAGADVSCPPAVPVVICGEEIGPEAVKCLRYYGVKRVRVIKG